MPWSLFAKKFVAFWGCDVSKELIERLEAENARLREGAIAASDLMARHQQISDRIAQENDLLRTQIEEAQRQEPVAWAREWDGDTSDLGNMVVVFDKEECDSGVWHPLYARPVPAQASQNYYCNKCGYVGPDAIHKRAADGKECAYYAFKTPPQSQPSEDAKDAALRLAKETLENLVGENATERLMAKEAVVAIDAALKKV